ncbi:MAG: hypothetical protein EHM72_19860 [Calditrichaeota bacterium]|nr:MAG: hypothetical protein EHM72_19860 [Calditrichota bacterium]
MRGFPTIIVLAPDGLERDRTVGFDGDSDHFLATVTEWADNQNTLLSYLKRWREDSTDVEWNYRIAKRYGDRGQSDLAGRFFKYVKMLDPDDKLGYLQEAEFNLSLGELHNDANPAPLTEFLTTVDNADWQYQGYQALATFYEEKKEFENAIAVYRQALQKLPDSTSLLNGCAWMIHWHKLQTHFAWGIELAEHAVALAPGDAGILDTLAWLYFDVGQIEKAAETMSQALKFDPKSSYLKENLATMQNELKKQKP